MIDYATRNWLALVFRVRGTVVKRVAGRTTVCAGLAALVTHARSAWGLDLAIPVVVHTIVGVALGLLLVFRTNASYDRYWEGRRIVGNIVGKCRDLARQTAAYLAADPERRQLAGRYIAAYFAAVKRQLRREDPHAELSELLGEERAARLEQEADPVLSVATALSALFVAAADEGAMSETRLRNMDTNLTALVAHWADAERIHDTPIPFAYAHHIKVFLTLFCFTVPLTLAQATIWYAVVGAAVVAFGMFGIDEIGVEIEEPFGYDANDLALDDIGRDLTREITALTAISSRP